jgi:hypothetical protein
MSLSKDDRQINAVLEKLAKSPFRAKQKLTAREIRYYHSKGRIAIEQHTLNFINQRLAPAVPENDGKQTPMKGHPVFIAQHATATCCRNCLLKWHNIKKNRPLTRDNIEYIKNIISVWLSRKIKDIDGSERFQGRLF